LKDSKIIVGAKSIINYIAAAVFAFENNASIELSAIGSNCNKQDRIVRLLSVFGVRETGRYTEKVGEVTAVICCLERNHEKDKGADRGGA